MKQVINNLLRRAGFEISRVRTKNELVGRLSHVRELGLNPGTVIDIGAAWGEWSKECNKVFKGMSYMLVEPLSEYKNSLRKVVEQISKAAYVQSALARESGDVTINVHPDLEGSSFYLEEEDSGVNGTPRAVSATTLDELCTSQNAVPPYLIKIDVQGAELDVLAGGEQAIKKVEYIILETSLFESYKGAPLIHDVVKFMHSKGFVPYDVISRLYRPLDGALCQMDVCFVREEGFLRKEQFYATKEQREKHTHHMCGRHKTASN